MNLEALNAEVRECTRCRLCESRTNAICGEGDPHARLMFIAQAPGEVEDREGRMFLGPSGRVFFELLAPAGIDREDFYMTNLLKCRLPKNRKPKQDEIMACVRYLEREIVLVGPKLLVPLGYYATRYVFEKYALAWPSLQEPHSLFGSVRTTGGCTILPLQHPAALLHNPALREEMVTNYGRLKPLIDACGRSGEKGES